MDILNPIYHAIVIHPFAEYGSFTCADIKAAITEMDEDEFKQFVEFAIQEINKTYNPELSRAYVAKLDEGRWGWKAYPGEQWPPVRQWHTPDPST
jgi:hypothetical protein